mmetsp:Transcript_13278/g.41639  ORF Transcript_13278/g.41639 Transcript_13278/m.41639 type:complete len:254 (+) Transcript_13278:202-963(+)
MLAQPACERTRLRVRARNEEHVEHRAGEAIDEPRVRVLRDRAERADRVVRERDAVAQLVRRLPIAHAQRAVMADARERVKCEQRAFGAEQGERARACAGGEAEDERNAQPEERRAHQHMRQPAEPRRAPAAVGPRRAAGEAQSNEAREDAEEAHEREPREPHDRLEHVRVEHREQHHLGRDEGRRALADGAALGRAEPALKDVRVQRLKARVEQAVSKVDEEDEAAARREHRLRRFELRHQSCAAAAAQRAAA